MAAELDLDDVAAQSPLAQLELARLRVQLEHALVGNAAEAEDAARYRKLSRDFAAMSVDIDGNHTWVHRRSLSLRGPTMDAAVDALPG